MDLNLELDDVAETDLLLLVHYKFIVWHVEECAYLLRLGHYLAKRNNSSCNDGKNERKVKYSQLVIPETSL